jgi:HSP20 family molecular chaperone IbpA
MTSQVISKIDEMNRKRWLLGVRDNRENGQPVQYLDGSKGWVINHKFHRIGGPAFEDSLDIIEKENEIVVSAELPGTKKEDIKITFENNILTLSSERKAAEVSEKATVLLKEIRNSGFERSVKFGYEIDAAKISAEMSDGVLTVTLPKSEQAKPKQIEVKVK